MKLDELDCCAHGKPLGKVTEYCPKCADAAREQNAPLEYNARYLHECLLFIAAAVARVVEDGGELDAPTRESLRVHLNRVRHEQKKLRWDDPEWTLGRCRCCWSYVIDADFEPEGDG